MIPLHTTIKLYFDKEVNNTGLGKQVLTGVVTELSDTELKFTINDELTIPVKRDRISKWVRVKEVKEI